VAGDRDEPRGDERRDDELKTPEERVEDLAPDQEESADVKGGAATNWWQKVDP
jgi:hypothetical protein